MRRPKKLIATGWDKPDAARLRQNLELMEKQPFDGIVIEVTGRTEEQKTIALRGTFSRQAWKREWFSESLGDLKACRFKRFTDNFVTVGANPGDVDWFDDDGWRQIVEHWRIAAWLAHEAGFKGVLFDAEPYTKPFAQFSYPAQARHDEHSFHEYYAKARERGREVMLAVTKEYPGITLFCYFMNCYNGAATGRADPRPVLETQAYGLYPAFIDGWLDVAPPTVTFVDGCERAYLFDSAMQYLEAALLIKNACQELVSPANRARYRAQVQAGFGMYLDAYWNPPGSIYFIPPAKGGTRVDQLGANVSAALRAADEYVWVYGERFRWWPTPNTRVQDRSWAEALPGCDKVLAFARDPAGFARAELAALSQAGKLTNLARNGDFQSAQAAAPEGAPVPWRAGSPPAGWSAWQAAGSNGAFTWDRETGASGKGSARAAGVSEGCLIQSYPVTPGERYVVQAVRRLQGRGSAWIRVRWQTAGNKWTEEERDVIFPAEGARESWGEMFGVVTVPESAGKLLILLGAGGQAGLDDGVWFDDVRLFPLVFSTTAN